MLRGSEGILSNNHHGREDGVEGKIERSVLLSVLVDHEDFVASSKFVVPISQVCNFHTRLLVLLPHIVE